MLIIIILLLCIINTVLLIVHINDMKKQKEPFFEVDRLSTRVGPPLSGRGSCSSWGIRNVSDEDSYIKNDQSIFYGPKTK